MVFAAEQSRETLCVLLGELWRMKGVLRGLLGGKQEVGKSLDIGNILSMAAFDWRTVTYLDKNGGASTRKMACCASDHRELPATCSSSLRLCRLYGVLHSITVTQLVSTQKIFVTQNIYASHNLLFLQLSCKMQPAAGPPAALSLLGSLESVAC